MGIYIEALVLYILLFFSGSMAQITGITAQAAGFSAIAGIVRIVLYIIPAIVLIWYLLLKTWKLEYWVIRPGRKDLISGLITFPFLLLTGFAIAYLSSYIDGTATVKLVVPSSAAQWIVLCIICILAAYLEESFFRFYLLSRRQEMNMSAASALIFSVILFSVCHVYEGPWGFLNAVISGTFLGFMFLRYNSIHGIAVAHGLYNIVIYAAYAVLTLYKVID